MSYSIKTLEQVEAFKIIISTPTRAKSPEETLESLTEFDIDWYVTEEGTLMIRYWQIAAEDFVSQEQAAEIRLTRQSPEQSDKLDWLSKNLQSIRSKYAGQWIAIYDNRIVAAATNLPDLMNKVIEFDRPFITFISSDQVVWDFTYAS